MGDRLIILAEMFERMEEGRYEEITQGGLLTGLYRQLNTDYTKTARSKTSEPFSEIHIPSYESYRSFANQILTPGIPGSLPPIGSLYRTGSSSDESAPNTYLSDRAIHLKILCEQLAIKIPPHYQATPDHLSLLIDLLVFLSEHASPEEVDDFIESHFDWLDSYYDALTQRMEVEHDPSLKSSIRFYRFLVGLLIGRLSSAKEGSKSERAAEVFPEGFSADQRSKWSASSCRNTEFFIMEH